MLGAADQRHKNDALTQQMQGEIFNAMRGATTDQQNAVMNLAAMDQRDKELMISEPSKIEEFMQNFGVGAGWVKDNKDLIKNVLGLVL
jgi:hypothetical protein